MKNSVIVFLYFLFITPIFAQPVIHAFTPLAAEAGSSVIITGTGFSTNADSNTVYFGAAKTIVTSASDTLLKVIVPAGATYEPISVTTNFLTANSALSFNLVFPGAAGSFVPGSFLQKRDISLGNYPHSTSLADFNGDGKPDIVVSKGSSGTVSVITNSSNLGNLLLGQTIELVTNGNNHEGVATADFDGDGKIDFVLTNSNNLHSISIFRNTTVDKISFAPKMDLPVDNAPYLLSIGDLNSDGKPDIAVANNGSDVITIYKNTSDSGHILFSEPVHLLAGENPFGILITDLEKDGKPDLAYTTQGLGGGLLKIMQNTTIGDSISFADARELAYVGGAFNVSGGDLDGDGLIDLVAASGGGHVVVLRNTSTAGSVSFGIPNNFYTGNYTNHVTICDLDGDGKPDLAAVNRNSHNISALRNISVTGSILFEDQVSYQTGQHPVYITAGDIDGDSRPELITSNSSESTISIFKNIHGANIAPVIHSFDPGSGFNGDSIKINGNNFSGITSVSFGGVEASSFIVDSVTGITAIVGSGATGDVVVTTSTGVATLTGFTFNGPRINSFSPATAVSGTVVSILGSNFTNVTAVKFGGIDAASYSVLHSGMITAVVGNANSGDVSVITNNGTATLPGFSFGVPVIHSFTPASGPAGSVVTINGENFLPSDTANTIFMGAVGAKIISATSNQLQVIVPAGTTFQPITVTTNRLTAYSKLPFVLTSADSSTLSIHSFSIEAEYAAGNWPAGVYLKDLDADGKPEIITINSIGNNLSVLKNSSTPGTLFFNSRTFHSTGPDPKSMATGDFNGDGKPDIAVANFNAGNAGSVSILRNTSLPGNILFAPTVNIPSGAGTNGMNIQDLNGDGKPDMVVTSGNTSTFSVFINTTVPQGSITFLKHEFPLNGHPGHLVITDLNQDGKPDIVVSKFSNTSISVYRNTSSAGNFALSDKIDFVTGLHPSRISAGDMDGDGIPDILVTNFSDSTISFFKNSSTGSIISLQPKVDIQVAATNIFLSDLNGDGSPDITSGRYLSGKISIFQNTFPVTNNLSDVFNVEFNTSDYDTYVTVGDLDGDGFPDIAVANTIRGTVSILKNKMNTPLIDSLSNATAPAGSIVNLSGSNFTEASSVKFGGTEARSFTVQSSTKIQAEVGGGASGEITVTTPSGTASISGFKFIPEIITEGQLRFCADEEVILKSSAIANNKWYKDGLLISGANQNTLSVKSSGIYTVKTTSNGITTTSPQGITVKVDTVPAPEISIDADYNLLSSAAIGNQWYLNGNVITGAVNQVYKPGESGLYTVKATSNGCASPSSIAYNFVMTGIINLGNNQFIKLFPNPVKDKIFLNWQITGTYNLNIDVKDINGRLITRGTNLLTNEAIDLSALAPGVYFIRIYNQNKKIDRIITIVRSH